MANIAAYSRHKMFEEFDSPLFTNKGDGATPLVYTPNEQRSRAMANLTDDLMSFSSTGVIGLSRTGGATAAAADIITITASSGSTEGATSVEPFNHDVTMTGAGGVGGRAKFTMTTNVALGSWSNALKAEVTYGASGRTSGLGSAMVAEMTLSAGTSSGTYALYEGELNLGASASTGTLTSLYHASVNGAAAGTFDANGYFFNLQGLTAGATNVFNSGATITNVNEFTHGLRIRMGAEDYYIPLVAAAAFLA